MLYCRTVKFRENQGNFAAELQENKEQQISYIRGHEISSCNVSLNIEGTRVMKNVLKKRAISFHNFHVICTLKKKELRVPTAKTKIFLGFYWIYFFFWIFFILFMFFYGFFYFVCICALVQCACIVILAVFL